MECEGYFGSTGKMRAWTFSFTFHFYYGEYCEWKILREKLRTCTERNDIMIWNILESKTWSLYFILDWKSNKRLFSSSVLYWKLEGYWSALRIERELKGFIFPFTSIFIPEMRKFLERKRNSSLLFLDSEYFPKENINSTQRSPRNFQSLSKLGSWRSRRRGRRKIRL